MLKSVKLGKTHFIFTRCVKQRKDAKTVPYISIQPYAMLK